MMKDRYANYVLQEAIKFAEGDLLESLVAVVISQFISMRQNPSTANSKQLISIEQLLREKGFSLDAIQTLRIVVSPPASQDQAPSGFPCP
jgi:hypothetical protein